ncbi:MAG: transcription antitermination factor NusB [Treponema sp.]|nr:transcription antitermination factor NusB [Treponema sp.]
MTRRESRIVAFQGLYSWDVGNIPLEEVLAFSWVEHPAPADDEGWAFARLLIAGTVECKDEIDGIITKFLKNWDFSRLNKVTVAILRMSVYSLMKQKDIMPSIVIDEAIHIAKEFGPDDSYKFINAILDNIKKSLE